MSRACERIVNIGLALTLVPAGGALFADTWQRNSFPGQGHFDNSCRPGWGWDHMENIRDLSVSPVDPKLRAVVDNEWTVVLTGDGANLKPLVMPHIGTPHCEAQSIEFSRYDASTIYLLVAHDYWKSIDPAVSPAGLWRSTDRGSTWEHLYRIPAGHYERYGNNPGRTHVLEDPSPSRKNHLYFGTTSHGIVRSTDGGASWETVAAPLSNRCIKTLAAGVTDDGGTVLYAIAEKKMARHVSGENVPIDNWAFPDTTACWRLDRSGWDVSRNGHHLAGSPAGWSESSAQGSHAAIFDGTSGMTAKDLKSAGTHDQVTVAAWVNTSDPSGQSIVSCDRGTHWELGLVGDGKVRWSVCGSDGMPIDLLSPESIQDGEWHHVVGTFDRGVMRIYIDGEEAGAHKAGLKALGGGEEGTGDVVVGSGFRGCLDDIRVYLTRSTHLHGARGLYYQTASKNPVAQGALWRIRIGADGKVLEGKRLLAGFADVCDIELNPRDPSSGWLIRKGFPNGWPHGGRELHRFSDFGDAVTLHTNDLGGSRNIREITVNPADPNHVALFCGGPLRHAFRFSRDGGASWQATDRAEGDRLPSLQSWMPRDHAHHGRGLPADVNEEGIGQQTAFVPGSPNELLWIMPFHGGLMRSTDWGATFATCATGGPNKDLCQMALAPSDPARWAVPSYENGFVTTTDNGFTWHSANYDNSPALLELANRAEAAGDWWTAARTAGGVAFHPTNPDIMLGSWTRQGYLVRSTDAGKTWTDTGARNPMELLVDVYWSRVDPNRVYCGRLRSSDAGANWTNIGKCVMAVSGSNPDIVAGMEEGVGDVAKGTLGLHVSVNGGASWTRLPDPPAEKVPGLDGKAWEVTGTCRTWNHAAGRLLAIDPHPQYDPKERAENRLRILLAGRSGIYEYRAPNPDGSGSESDWQLHSTGLESNPHHSVIEPVPWMGFVVFDPRPGHGHVVYAAKTMDARTLCNWATEGNPNIAYPGGANLEPFYRSTDGGVTWEKLHGAAYPDAPRAPMIHDLDVDSSGRLFAATCEGIYIFTPTGGDRGKGQAR